MTEIKIPSKLFGLIPENNWKNPKGHISALTKGGKVILYGESNLGGVPNCCRSRGSSCHSEMEVVKHLQNKLNNNDRKIKKYIIWNIRWSKSGEIVNSKPCKNCQESLINIGMQYIVYSTDDGTFVKERIANLNCKKSSGFR